MHVVCIVFKKTFQNLFFYIVSLVRIYFFNPLVQTGSKGEFLSIINIYLTYLGNLFVDGTTYSQFFKTEKNTSN